jgi:6-phosphofructokinase 2
MTAIITLTPNPALDLSTTVEAMLPDRKLRTTDTQREPGGGGLNVARVVRELGGDVCAAFPQGGATGAELTSLVEKEGLPYVALPIAEATRENITVLESRSGAQYRLVLEGPTLSPAEQLDLRKFVQGLRPAPKYLVLSGSLPPGVPPNFYKQLAAEVSPATRVIVDTSGPALAGLQGANVFLIKPNLRELSQLVGRELESDRAIVDAARSLIKARTCNAVFVSMGARGACLVTEEQSARLIAPPVKPLSRVGAGDSTVAGTVAALARGDELFAAARLGVASGTAAVLTPGTQLCTRADVERLFPEVELLMAAR